MQNTVATHFHDLVDMVTAREMSKIGFYCTDVAEDDRWTGGFRYLHKLREGINRQSHALKVARLAGLPQDAIDIARAVLDRTDTSSAWSPTMGVHSEGQHSKNEYSPNY